MIVMKFTFHKSISPQSCANYYKENPNLWCKTRYPCFSCRIHYPCCILISVSPRILKKKQKRPCQRGWGEENPGQRSPDRTNSTYGGTPLEYLDLPPHAKKCQTWSSFNLISPRTMLMPPSKHLPAHAQPYNCLILTVPEGPEII